MRQLIERWKEEARKVTTYTTSRSRFLQPSLPRRMQNGISDRIIWRGLIETPADVIIGGVASRRLPDRTSIGRSRMRGCGKRARLRTMMQELAGRFRQEWAPRFPASPRDVVCLANPDTTALFTNKLEYLNR